MTIEWLLFVGCLVWITGLALFLPEMFAPRCPICGSILEQRPAEHAGSLESLESWLDQVLLQPLCLFSSPPGSFSRFEGDEI